MDWYSMTDIAIEQEIGARVQKERLKQNITQSRLAKLTGLSRVTISLFETGKGSSLSSCVQIMRALQKLENFDSVLPSAEQSPVEILRMQEKGTRQRARQKKHRSK
jgi:transcriptional regulator with XRE-family HTH domain